MRGDVRERPASRASASRRRSGRSAAYRPVRRALLLALLGELLTDDGGGRLGHQFGRCRRLECAGASRRRSRTRPAGRRLRHGDDRASTRASIGSSRSRASRSIRTGGASAGCAVSIPACRSRRASTAIHGIRDEDVRGAADVSRRRARARGVSRRMRSGRIQHRGIRPARAAHRVPARRRPVRGRGAAPHRRPADLLRARAAPSLGGGALLLSGRARRARTARSPTPR